MVDPSIAPNNLAFTGFLMIALQAGEELAGIGQ
jgi:hypothetical protein